MQGSERAQKLLTGWAEVSDLAVRAIGFARVTAPPAMPDQQVAEKGPKLLRHELLQLALDLFGSRFTRQAQTLR